MTKLTIKVHGSRDNKPFAPYHHICMCTINTINMDKNDVEIKKPKSAFFLPVTEL